jgi:hypothetical protein
MLLLFQRRFIAERLIPKLVWGRMWGAGCGIRQKGKSISYLELGCDSLPLRHSILISSYMSQATERLHLPRYRRLEPSVLIRFKPEKFARDWHVPQGSRQKEVHANLGAASMRYPRPDRCFHPLLSFSAAWLLINADIRQHKRVARRACGCEIMGICDQSPTSQLLRFSR